MEAIRIVIFLLESAASNLTLYRAPALALSGVALFGYCLLHEYCIGDDPDCQPDFTAAVPKRFLLAATAFVCLGLWMSPPGSSPATGEAALVEKPMVKATDRDIPTIHAARRDPVRRIAPLRSSRRKSRR